MELKSNFLQDLEKITTLADLDAMRVKYFGKQGIVTEALKSLGSMDPEKRKEKGAELNILRDTLQCELTQKKESLDAAALCEKLEKERLDVTLPSLPNPQGRHHIVTHTLREMAAYFLNLGFKQEEGPDIDNEDHNFNALNIPEHHPARQNHDTFYIESNEPLLLRTHTSTVQIRTLKNQKPPLRVISMGRVYRADYDATHLPMFHQMEGFVIEEGIHLGHLKGCLNDFCRAFFNKKNLQTRFRPSFFPFTEPSFEMDIQGDNGQWLEVLGCGMIHPQVLINVGLDPSVHQGFAFGMGVDRFAMLKYAVNDIRHFISGDVRWARLMGIPQAFAV